jgi:hypothetical protein
MSSLRWRGFPALWPMVPRHAVLLTPLESVHLQGLPFYKHIPPVSPLFPTLTKSVYFSHSIELRLNLAALYFHTVTNSFALPKITTPLFSCNSKLFVKNTRGGGPLRKQKTGKGTMLLLLPDVGHSDVFPASASPLRAAFTPTLSGRLSVIFFQKLLSAAHFQLWTVDRRSRSGRDCQLSTFPSPKSFAMRSSAKPVRNPFRIRTYETSRKYGEQRTYGNSKSFRIRTCKKNGGEGGVIVN